jgi:hypothetical protein
MVYYNKIQRENDMMSLFKVKTADEVEDKLLKIIEKYETSIQKEELKGNMVGLNGLLFAKRAKDKIESMGIAISPTQIHMLKDSIATKQTDRMNNIILEISKSSGLPNSSKVGTFKELNLGVKGDSKITAVGDSLLKANVMTQFAAVALPIAAVYYTFKGIAALFDKASDMAYKAGVNKDMLKMPEVETRKNINSLS